MDYGNPGPGGGSSTDMFSDGAPGGEKDAAPEGQTGILPKTLMGGKEFKPGEEIVLKVVAVHENDFEVEYAHDEGGEKEGPTEGGEPAPEAPPEGGAGGPMNSMMY